MDNENISCAYDGEENAQLSPLQRLPVEIFLHICSFLDGSTLVHGLRLVCTRFYLILKDANSLWKARINHIWPDASYPLLPLARPDKLCWMLSYVAIKQQTALWKQQKNRLFMKETHGSIIDAVSLMHVNGISHVVYTSNRHLHYKEIPSRKKLSHEIENSGRICAHSSGIKDMTAIDNTIYSCSSLGRNVKSWMLTNAGLVHQRTYDLPRSDLRFSSLWPSCMCMCMSSTSLGPGRNLFATGLDCGTIYVFDSRSRNNPIRHYQHRTLFTVQNIRLTMNTEYILSAAEDTVSVWDQRAGRIMKSITFPGEAHRTACINMRRDLVFVATTPRSWDSSQLHVLNPKDDFKLVKSYSTEHTKRITRVHLTHECLITSSKDGTVRISSLTDPPKPIATLCSEFGGIYDMDYLNGTLAISGDGIEVWCPKLTCSTKRVQRNNNKWKVSIRDL
ncbi:F-box/WD repeat-containing protein 9-like [Temnothorax curvispinosus]|uniref:F-box/WD repeat-containing protein 9-like n=1 Tax=Temnothorax curvispinosus TaxID=300111 RepID=A0A6J1RIL6_9HYME|nr:F-box/WD repeat-containing protein 9-like [Temnothorax curvispinosus]